MDNFFASLEELLGELPERDRRSLINKYREHFNLDMSLGKTEEEIVAFLGNPKTVARYIIANHLVEKAEADANIRNVFKAVLGSMSLGVFNLVFFLGPFLVLIAVLAALFAAGLGVSLTGAIALSGVFTYPALPIIDLPPDLYIDTFTRFGTFFLSLGLISFGLLFLAADFAIIGIFYKGTLKHIRFHLGNLQQGSF